MGDELAAVAHYFRALAVARPFLVARDNLLLLFEQNRIRCATLSWLRIRPHVLWLALCSRCLPCLTPFGCCLGTTHEA